MVPLLTPVEEAVHNSNSLPYAHTVPKQAITKYAAKLTGVTD